MRETLQPYANKSGNSGVAAYATGETFIVVEFNTGVFYKYTYDSAGADAVEEMKGLAIDGLGLSTYISQQDPRYEARAEALHLL